MEAGGSCLVCGRTSRPVAGALGVCLDCIRERSDEAMPYIRRAHEEAKKRHGLPGRPPRIEEGAPCNLCSNNCLIGDGEMGFCGLRWNEGGLRSKSTRDEGLYYSYKDPHVTNCCAAWFCPAGTGAGYPKYTYRDGPERGYSNLAVFMYGCNFDCLFCQNPSHKDLRSKTLPKDDIANKVRSDRRISCICYFGGNPEPQLPFILDASKLAIEARKGVPLRICFEWNGCGNPALVKRAAETSLVTGGNVKFDLKAFTPELSLALSGVPNERAYRNFEMVAEEIYPERRELPVLTATTLLVPGYVDAAEVEAIAKFIAGLDPSIPYSLLVFHPAYLMKDLPYTSLRQAVECYRVARKHLERVHVGNLHILGLWSMSQFTSVAKGR
ncbi:MAG: radical SAM protein [Candidatus Bathyarchaeia archaeon]